MTTLHQEKTAADYSFSSSASWVGVDATGKVTFKNDGDSNTVIITAPQDPVVLFTKQFLLNRVQCDYDHFR